MQRTIEQGLLRSVSSLILIGSSSLALAEATNSQYGLNQITSDLTPVHCTLTPKLASSRFDFLKAQHIDLPDTAIIEKVLISRLPIFDKNNPAENNKVYRFANRVHHISEDQTIRQQLLFAEGQRFDKKQLEESARILREQDHLYDATIRVVSLCGDKAVVEVVTKDVWSLNLEASIGRSGGQNTHRFGISESNLFGSGKKVTLVSKKDDDRETNLIAFEDNNLFGSRIRTALVVSDSDDGANTSILVQQPFYALDTRRARGIKLSQGEQVDSQYFKGTAVSEVRKDRKHYSVYYGISNGLGTHKQIQLPLSKTGARSNRSSDSDHSQVKVVQRLSLGYTYFKEEFTATNELPSPLQQPRDQTLSYPFIQYEAVEDNYTTSFNFNQIHRTEDLHLGFTFRTSLGYAASDLGASENKFVFNGGFQDTIIYNSKALLQHSLNWRGLWNQDLRQREDVEINYGIKYFRNQTDKRSFFAAFNASYTDNLNSNRQVLLGGESGMRGFDRRIQNGDRRMTLTLEERQYTNYHVLNLAWLGFAAFVDLGRAWTPGADDGLDDSLLADVGVGLRLASSKADAGRIIHIDFAVPLTNRDDPIVDSYQIAISIKNSL